ncbi:thioredoxin [Bacillus phage CAM003]|uniref:Thioredoxin n=1 Tax=Bacillus phage CAM003 TaxID=1486657 RepID=A0A024B0P3_9CAUD|nr:thioredoxin [Bacillus phage CAM003]AHZ09573.1 thioredoxin [Bacillus phage CAM003]
MRKLIKVEQTGCAPCIAVGNYLKDELDVPHTVVNVGDHPDVAAFYELASVPTTLLIEVEDPEELKGKELARSIKFNPSELDELAAALTE